MRLLLSPGPPEAQFAARPPAGKLPDWKHLLTDRKSIYSGDLREPRIAGNVARMPVTLINPPDLARPVGYSHGASGHGRLLAIAGQVGWDGAGALVSPDFTAQFERAIANLARVLAEAGGRPEELLSVRVYVTDKREYLAATRAVGAAWRKHLGRHFPAMALVEVKALLEEGAKVEIEGLAVIGDRSES
jgi:enamine deaminase RidA (YjgF/YER057c/UK114 family)